jgi:CheY-like chemotaxis protein
VILLDLHLPRQDGGAVLKAISREPALANVHVAVWTTLGSPREREEALSYGADLYRLKPTSLEGYWELAALLIEMCHGQVLKAAMQ